MIELPPNLRQAASPGPKVSEGDLLMAAAEMHSEGRFDQPPVDTRSDFKKVFEQKRDVEQSIEDTNRMLNKMNPKKYPLPPPKGEAGEPVTRENQFAPSDQGFGYRWNTRT